jgi:hypothetical protein
MKQTLFTPSQTPNDPAADRPESHASPEDPASAEIGWKLGMLREMAEMGMEMARDVRDQAVAEPAPEPPAKAGGDSDALARAFARLTRAVRMAIALHTRLEEDHRRQGEASAAERERRAAAARDKHRAYQRAKVKRVIDATLDDAAGDDDDDDEAGEDSDERERLEDEWRERLLDFDDYALGGQRSVGEIIARICRDLGVTPDWARWVDADWARDEMTTKPPGSPYAVWPPIRPARKSASGARSGAAAATGPP